MPNTFTRISNDVLSECLPILSESELKVFLVLCRYADNHTRCAWPSQQRIAQEAGISRRTVNRAVDTLIERALVRRAGYNDRNTVYRILDSISTPESATEDRYTRIRRL